jgi:hypothetical protein
MYPGPFFLKCLCERVARRGVVLTVGTSQLKLESTDSYVASSLRAAIAFIIAVIIIIIIIIIINVVSCHRPFLSGTSLEPAVIPTAQASSFRLPYFPYYV